MTAKAGAVFAAPACYQLPLKKLMGMRRNIRLDYGGTNQIYLYTHWGAQYLEDTLRVALIRDRSRWSDPEYLARIIFSEMIKDEVLDTNGYGLAPYEMDDQYPTIRVDLQHQTVGRQPFEEFVNAAC
jgi:hypothetical protein